MIEASILIVSKNRKSELQRTLEILKERIDKKIHEVRVFLDGPTENAVELQNQFPWVHWLSSSRCIGASPARNILFRKAVGRILFGFDDDAHPMQEDFITTATTLFAANSRIGIISFKEIRGTFESVAHIPILPLQKDYLVKEFLGCGFAIRKSIYDRIRGFPSWIDIYGEEVCVAIETIEMDYDILLTHRVVVHHRTQKQKKNIGGANYYRFGRQLKNTANFYIVYYPLPLLPKKIALLFCRNFVKYALKDSRFFRVFLATCGRFIFGIPGILKMRKPVNPETLQRFNYLPNPEF